MAAKRGTKKDEKTEPTEPAGPDEKETRETDPPPTEKPAESPAGPSVGEDWPETASASAAPEPAKAPEPASAAPAAVNGANGHANGKAGPRPDPLAFRLVLLSLPEGASPVPETIARCIPSMAPVLLAAAVSAFRAAAKKPAYKVVLLTLDDTKEGEAAIAQSVAI